MAEPRRDDRVLRATRWTAVLVTPVLVVAGGMLTAFPGDTERLWAWPITPDLTALAVGGGYLGGALFFARASLSRRWSPLDVSFLAATALTAPLLVATLLHWQNFSHGHLSFWAWLLLYVVTPWLLPLLWARNRRVRPPVPPPGRAGQEGPEVPAGLRAAVAAGGAAHLVIATAMFVRPALAIGRWPWELTPLTARTLASFIAFVGVVYLSFLWERRWPALRLHVESVTVGILLVGLGALRARGDLVGPVWSVTLFTVLVVATLAGLVALQVRMRRARVAAERQPVG